MTNNSVKYKVFVTQYFCTILDINDSIKPQRTTKTLSKMQNRYKDLVI